MDECGEERNGSAINCVLNVMCPFSGVRKSGPEWNSVTVPNGEMGWSEEAENLVKTTEEVVVGEGEGERRGGDEEGLESRKTEIE